MRRQKLIGNLLLVVGVISIALSLLLQDNQQAALSVTGAVLAVIGAVIVMRDRPL